MNNSGFNAIGMDVPNNRIKKGYEMLKHTGYYNSNVYANMIIKLYCDYIKMDATSFIIGALDGNLINGKQPCVDKQLVKIDLTSRYMILSSMLTD